MVTQEHIITPSSEDDREKMKKVISEVANSMTRADGEKEYQKEALKALGEEFDIKPKYLRKMAVDFNKDKFESESGEREDYEALYETVMK